MSDNAWVVTTGDVGDPVVPDDQLRLPPLDGSQLYNLPTSMAKALVSRVTGAVLTSRSFGEIMVGR